MSGFLFRNHGLSKYGAIKSRSIIALANGLGFFGMGSNSLSSSDTGTNMVSRGTQTEILISCAAISLSRFPGNTKL
jgi:hypothetical protein